MIRFRRESILGGDHGGDLHGARPSGQALRRDHKRRAASLARSRELLVKYHTQLTSCIRGQLAELDIVAAQGRRGDLALRNGLHLGFERLYALHLHALHLQGVLPSDVAARTHRRYVGRLRKALSGTGEKDPIRTVRGAGYSFDETFGKAP